MFIQLLDAGMTLKTRLNQGEKSAPILSGHAASVAAIILFACGFPAADVLLETWGPISLIATRVILAVLLLFPLWIAFDGWRSLRNAPWLRGFWIGAVGFGFGMIGLIVTQSMTNAVTAALVVAMMPIAAVTLEVMFDGRKLTINFIMGVLLVIFGGFIAAGANLTDAKFGLGAVIGISSTFMFAWGSRKTVKGLPNMTSLGQTTLTFMGAMLFCLVVLALFLAMGWQGTQMSKLSGHGWTMMLLYAWGAMAVSQLLWILSVSKMGIGLVSFHMNAAPFYVMLILLVMGGRWNWDQAIGAGLVAAGVIFAQRGGRWIVVAAE
jgi:drug/metabolite transporter (DMT)-like permease